RVTAFDTATGEVAVSLLCALGLSVAPLRQARSYAAARCFTARAVEAAREWMIDDLPAGRQRRGQNRQWRGSEPRQEAAGRVEKAVVGGAVDSAQVGLFDSADLELEGNDQGGESDDADDVGDDEGEAGGGDGHGSEDGVADPGEDAGCDELGAFVGVDPDPPRGAHLKLSDRRGRDAGECDHDPGGAQSRVIKERHGVEASKSGDGGGDAGCDGGDEGELGPPGDAAGVGVEAQAGVA